MAIIINIKTYLNDSIAVKMALMFIIIPKTTRRLIWFHENSWDLIWWKSLGGWRFAQRGLLWSEFVENMLDNKWLIPRLPMWFI